LHPARRARLEPLRNSLPAVYAEMNRRAFSTEAGRYYVLDSITGPRMATDYRESDYRWIQELLEYPRTLDERLRFSKTPPR